MKNTKYSDIHAHLFKSFYKDGKIVLEEAQNNGVETIFLVGTSLKDSQEAIEIAKKFTKIYPTIGIHPSDVVSVEDTKKLWEVFDDSVIAIGEIGLDYYHKNNPKKEIQIACLEEQIKLAKNKGVPVIIHNREAHQDILEIISKFEYKNVIFVMHTFSGDEIWAKKFLKVGAYLSFSGVLTFKNAKSTRRAAGVTPIDRIFVETDSPFLTPTPNRGKKNHPKFVKYTLDFLANLKGLSPSKLNIQINKNIKKVFKI